FFFSSRRRHTRFKCDWSSDVCSPDLTTGSSFSSLLGPRPPRLSTSWAGPTCPAKCSCGLSLLGLLAKIKCSICSYQSSYKTMGRPEQVPRPEANTVNDSVGSKPGLYFLSGYAQALPQMRQIWTFSRRVPGNCVWQVQRNWAHL